MTMKKDETLTKREALIQAWKKRKDYKGYDRSKGGAFNSWRAIIRTAKGKEIGFPSSWATFDSFMSDVQGEWSMGKVACRLDARMPHSSKNSFWGEKGAENSGRLVRLEYDGEQKTLIEWAQELGLNYQGVRQRYHRCKDLSAHEILFGKTKRTKTPQERSAAFRTLRMLGAYRLRDKARGQQNDLTIEFLRSQMLKGCFYCGDTEKIGLDRMDNARGHTQDNVVPCCYTCNCARMDNFSVEEMQKIGIVVRQIKEMRNANWDKRA